MPSNTMCQTHRNDLEHERDDVPPSEGKGDDSDVRVDVGLAAVVQEERVDCGTNQRGPLPSGQVRKYQYQCRPTKEQQWRRKHSPLRGAWCRSTAFYRIVFRTVDKKKRKVSFGRPHISTADASCRRRSRPRRREQVGSGTSPSPTTQAFASRV